MSHKLQAFKEIIKSQAHSLRGKKQETRAAMRAASLTGEADDWRTAVAPWAKSAELQRELPRLSREAREHHVAYSLALGRSYRQVEAGAQTPLDWSAVEAILVRHLTGEEARAIMVDALAEAKELAKAREVKAAGGAAVGDGSTPAEGGGQGGKAS